MSGTNPFRRKNNLEQEPGNVHLADDYEFADRAQFPRPVINTDVVKPAKKTVRIISPHSAADNEHRLPHELFSPPLEPYSSTQISPDSPDSFEGSSPIDPFEVVSSDDGGNDVEDEDLRRNTISNAGSLHGRPITEATVTLSPAPYPFTNRMEKAKSTSEPFKLENSSKPHYSVDEFKELLLTGRKPPLDLSVRTSHPTNKTLQAPGYSSSTTDASSISRQSLFGPLSGLQEDTPRSSHENPSKEEELRSHHGRPVTENAPQAVALDDFPVTSMTRGSTSGVSSPSLSRIPSDLNKALPPPPTAEATEADDQNTKISPPNPEFNKGPSSPIRRRGPPAPPLSRRQSQHKPKLWLGSSGRAHESPEGSPIDVYHPSSLLSNRVGTPLGPKQPPPPPPRRPGPVRGLSESSSASAMSTVATPTSSSFTDESITNVPKQRPPIPPARNRSTSSAKRSNRISSQSGSPNLPPAPPPRRRGSSQSSLGPFPLSADQQQTETVRQRSDSAASSVQSKDIIADLSMLQKEVDALRGKFRD